MKTIPNLVKIPDYADVIPIQEWLMGVNMGCFNDDDGDGFWATQTHQLKDDHFNIWQDIANHPDWATHVAWYGK